MYCENCGKQLNQEAKFCPDCGEKIKKMFNEKEFVSKLENNQDSKSKQKSIFYRTIIGIVSVASLLVIIGITRVLGFGAMILFGSIWLGTVFSKWYAKKQRKNNYVVMKWIGWSNIGTWIFPFLGLFTSAATVSFSRYSQDAKKKFKIIGWIFLSVSFLNGILGIIYFTS